MTRRIFRSILAVTVAILLAGFLMILGSLYGYFEDQLVEELASATVYIARGVETGGTQYLTSGLPDDHRVTWVAADGAVLFENWEEEAAMGSHDDRPEILTALASGHGTAQRYSDTLARKTYYDAVRLSDGSVLRTANTQDSIWLLVLWACRPVVLLLVLAFLLAFWLAGRISRQLVEPINEIDLNDPGEEAAFEELVPLLARLRSQNRQIASQMLELKLQREEFAAITENMGEGLLIIDHETRILTYNSAALRLLGAERPADEGESILALNRETGLCHCVDEALDGRSCEVMLEKGDRCCQIIANPVEQGDSRNGAVLILLDVTEKQRREQLRREFTANVSHELKTPLTAIQGTAEILESGFVKPEDVPHFIGNIRRDAQRLIELVNDIIHLSRLDEGGLSSLQWEKVDLHSIAQKALEKVETAAEQQEVTLRLEAEEVTAWTVPRILDDVLYNLCDNAVSYNRPGGRVTVTVVQGFDAPRIEVADTGIGIPESARERVFERFYRVDESHSGRGTGLGLSIVKHGAASLGIQIGLESEVGVGSTFTLTFPRKLPEKRG